MHTACSRVDGLAPREFEGCVRCREGREVQASCAGVQSILADVDDAARVGNGCGVAEAGIHRGGHVADGASAQVQPQVLQQGEDTGCRQRQPTLARTMPLQEAAPLVHSRGSLLQQRQQALDSRGACECGKPGGLQQDREAGS